MSTTRNFTIRTERLLLRPFTMEDVDDVMDYVNDQEWAEYQPNVDPAGYTRQEIGTLVEMFSNPEHWVTGHPGLPSDSNGAGLLRIFAITLDGRAIGEVALNQRDDDKTNARIEIAYTISRKHWGKGLATEAARAVMDWAFNKYDFNRLYAWCDAENVASGRVLEKLGLGFEGRLRGHIKSDGGFHDQLYYGMLRADWLDRQQAK